MKNEINLKSNPSLFTPLFSFLLPLQEQRGEEGKPHTPGRELNILPFVEKANQIKTNQTKNTIVNNTKFNAKTDSVNYYNNKLIIENSKFLNKNKNINQTVQLNKLNKKNLFISLASNYLDLNKDTNLNKANNQTSVVSSSLNNLNFTSNKYILQLLKNKKAIFKLEKAKKIKNIELAILKIELELDKLKNELELAIFLRRMEIGRLISIIKLENILTINELAKYYIKLEENLKNWNLELAKLIIKLDRERLKKKLKRDNLIKNLKLVKLKNDLDLDVDKVLPLPLKKNENFLRRAEAKEVKLNFPLKNLLKEKTKSIFAKKIKMDAKKKIKFNLKLIREHLNLAPIFELNNLNSKIKINFDFNKNLILNKKDQLLKGFNIKNKNLLHNYLNYFTYSNNIININPNLSKKYGLLLKYNRSIGYNFLNKININNTNWINEYKEETYKLLFYFFKSIYCLISKPTIIFEHDKITIRLFYFLFINKINKKRKERIYVKKVKFIQNNKRNIIKNNLASQGKPLNQKERGNLGEPRGWRLTASNFILNQNLIKEEKSNLQNYNLGSVYYDKFLIITNILSLLFNKPVNLEITRVHHLTYDTNILVNALQLVMKNKNLKPKLAIRDIYESTNIKGVNVLFLNLNSKVISYLSGLNININGRLLKDAIVPKNTVKKYESGASAPGKVNFIDTSFITNKNRKGAYNIKVKAAQNFF